MIITMFEMLACNQAPSFTRPGNDIPSHDQGYFSHIVGRNGCSIELTTLSVDSASAGEEEEEEEDTNGNDDMK